MFDNIKTTQDKFLEDSDSVSTADYLGGGFYSNVYDSDVEGIVVKVRNPYCHDDFREYRISSDGWIFWAIFCLVENFSSKMMPKIYALSVDFTNGSFKALMEKCEKQGIKRPFTSAAGTFNHISCHAMSKEFEEEYRSLMEKFELFLQGFFTVKELKEDIYIDAHISNWMQREDQLVLTDPIDFTDVKIGKLKGVQKELATFLKWLDHPNIRLITENGAP